jgi:serine/threonine-protein kinase RsbW
MPNLQLPQGAPADLSDLDDLPEGGFGWFLIRAMTSDLVYHRTGGQNCVRFCVNCA